MMRARAFLVLLTRRLAQTVALVFALTRSVMLLPFLVVGLMFQPVTFQRRFYASQEGAGAFQRNFPLLHFLLRGAWQLNEPHPAFSQIAMLRDFPKLRLQPPVLNHVLNPNADMDFPLSPISAVEEKARSGGGAADAQTAEERPARTAAPSPQPAPAIPNPSNDPCHDEFLRLFREDAQEICREVSSITPTPDVERNLRLRRVPPHRDATVAAAIRRLLQRFPDEIDLLFVVPWLGIRGGSEKVSERYLAYLRSRYPADRICIFAPDQIHAHSAGTASYYGIQIVAINDDLPEADQETRILIYDRVMVERRPAVVHNVNSLTAWMAHQRYGRFYKDSKLFLTLYSDIRASDRAPIGYYHNYMPYMLDEAHGVLCDNAAVRENFIADLAITEADALKLHVVHTPVIGLNGGDPRRDLRPWRRSKSRQSLWMSRIAPEKRLDIVQAIAAETPARNIAVYGAILPVSSSFDMGWMAKPNIDYRGEFERLRDMPFDEFDSYIFTSNGEGMPVAVLEVTMMGLPIIAPDVGGIGEFIDDDTGWLVSGPDAVDEYVEALRQIEADPDEAARRVRNAQDRLFARHSWPNFMRTLEAIPGYLQLEER